VLPPGGRALPGINNDYRVYHHSKLLNEFRKQVNESNLWRSGISFDKAQKEEEKKHLIGNTDYEEEDENYADDLGKSADSGLDFGSSSRFG
jgi:hypothetical protein